MKRLLSLLLPLSMLAACGIENEETRKVQDTYQPKDGEMSAVYTIKDIRADETDGTKWLIEAQPDAGGELQFKVDPATYHGPTEDELQKGLGKKATIVYTSSPSTIVREVKLNGKSLLADDIQLMPSYQKASGKLTAVAGTPDFKLTAADGTEWRFDQQVTPTLAAADGKEVEVYYEVRKK